MQIHLPDDFYRLVEKWKPPASELLQQAVRAEVRRRVLLCETDRYTAALAAEVGRPGPAERARAKAIAQRIARRAARKAD